MTKLADKINQYFELMEDIRTSLFRVLPVSDRYMCVVSFSTSMQALQCKLVNKVSLMEAHLLEGLTGTEIVTYGQYMKAAEDWAAGNMQGDYPFAQDADVYAEYRALTTSEEPEQDEVEQVEPEQVEPEQEDIQDLDNARTQILSASLEELRTMVLDAKLLRKNRIANFDIGDLQEMLFEHYGIDDDVEDDDEDDDTDGFESTQEYVESLSKNAALAKVETYGIPHLFSLADAWGFEKSTDVIAMRSLAKGYILRTFP